MGSEVGTAAYAGWVFHVGTSSLGYQFCRARFLVIKGKYVTMFKQDPGEYPRTIPIRSGLVGTHLMVEEVGRQMYHGRALYAMKIFNRLDHSRQGLFACTSVEELEKWVAAFKHAKDEAESSSGNERIGSGHRLTLSDDEFDINGPRAHSRSVSRGIAKFITIGRGPEALQRPSIVSPQEPDSDGFYNYPEGDTFDQADWRCFCTVNGLRIFEDITASKAEKGYIMKSVGVVGASPEIIFEQIMSLDSSLRYQWDILTGNLELVQQIDGHTDIVYGSFDPKYYKRFQSKQDFLFSRYWRRDQDGSYSITQVSTTHKKWPAKSGFQRINLTPGIWEITPLPSTPGAGTCRSLVTQIVEVKSTGWGRWKRRHCSEFHKTIPYILLCRIAGLRELFGANPEIVTVENQVKNKLAKNMLKVHGEHPVPGGLSSMVMQAPPESMLLETQEEFYDALMAVDPHEEEDENEEHEMVPKHETANQKFRAASWGVMVGISSKKFPATRGGQELDWNIPAVTLDPNLFHSALRRTLGKHDSNGWSDPGGKGFMVRSGTYNEDSLKISGGDPLLRLLAVDWLTSENRIDHIAKQQSCCVQSSAGRSAPFIVVINLQVPAKSNYSLVFYYVADRPIRPGSLLDQFVNGDNAFRNSRFKLIPSIVEGYWMVKRAVGTKACLLGKAVTCNYLREDNFLEIDVDIGSSSVARGVVGLVLGYVTTIVVDLAILIEAKSAQELPEYLLGTVRIDRIKVESSVQV